MTALARAMELPVGTAVELRAPADELSHPRRPFGRDGAGDFRLADSVAGRQRIRGVGFLYAFHD